VTKPADGYEQRPIFRWDSLKKIGPHEIQYQGNPVPGKAYDIELTGGKTVRVWQSDDGRQYFCHGLTFGGKAAPGGIISPYTGAPVETILQEHFQMIPEDQSHAGDILVWHGIAPQTTPHSAILIDPVVVQGKAHLDQRSRLQTKNGLSPEANRTLEQLIAVYGDSYTVHRRR
jgi:hypothetical protein